MNRQTCTFCLKKDSVISKETCCTGCSILVDKINDGMKMTQIKIPLRLAAESNSSDHWTKKAKRHKIQKLLVKSYLNRYELPPLPCLIKLTRIAPRQLDKHENLPMSFKWIIDAIADHYIPGLQAGRADSDPRLSFEFFQTKGDVEEYAIIIELISV